VSAGETVRVTSIHDAISVHYMVVGNAHIDEEAATSSMKSASSPPMYDRIGALGDQSWHSIIRAAVDKALLGRVAPLCLVLDDGLLMTMASASANSAAHVVTMTPGLSINCQSFENGTKAKSGTISVLKKKPALLVLKDLEGRKSLTTLLVWACSLGAYFASGMREHS
jgi:protein arginine N-methyltransferase 7